MPILLHTIAAVAELAFVADAYPYKNPDTIVVILKPTLRDGLPLTKSTLTFNADSFTVEAVLEAYEREVVSFLANTLRTAERLLAKSTQTRSVPLAPLCLN
ncbi:hypothetical protein [Spirosoma linguale]|uniref:Uncharacterized protein n=1 Tax=Spirosoma linguale (strain ATCC 33905 / DSM 74 / LMG 10896 / Claus 1) TaxID=504472 RepID=D2QP53_SPILD|nr:hypothetical protein Slin_3351 [Spirosoma linguale DSM 74]